MALLRRLAQSLSLVLLASTIVSATVPFDTCADFNTGETPKNTSIYMTNGYCQTHCMQEYAFAITQYQSCWCSNYAPAKSTEVDDDRCSTICPAWKEERCGGPGVFAYIVLANIAPSGTRGPLPSSTTSESSKSTDEAMTTTATTRVTETVQTTVTKVTTSDPPSVTSSSSSLSSRTTPSDSSTTSEPTSSHIQTVTLDGTVRTVTVNPAQTSGSSTSEENTNSEESHKSSGLGTGAVVGIVVGVVVAVLIAAGLAVFWFLRRRKQTQDDGYREDPSVRGGSPGTVGTGGPEMMGVGPGSAANTVGNRSSVLQIDPRMDPFRGQGPYARAGSQESLNTLRDDHDYSRRIQQPLRATNPDPDVD